MASMQRCNVMQEDKRPVRLMMMGVNILSGSHFDYYQFDFDAWVPNVANEHVFVPPALCGSAPSAGAMGSTRGAPRAHLLATLTALLPSSVVPSSSSSGRSSRLPLRIDAGALQQELTRMRLRGASSLATGASAEAPAAAATSDLAAIVLLNSQLGSASTGALGPVASARDLYRVAPNAFLGTDDLEWRATRLGYRPDETAGRRKRCVWLTAPAMWLRRGGGTRFEAVLSPLVHSCVTQQAGGS
jgi:hypothetical protein